MHCSRMWTGNKQLNALSEIFKFRPEGKDVEKEAFEYIVLSFIYFLKSDLEIYK